MPDHITRRDFLNAAAIGTGAALLSGVSPASVLAQQGRPHPWNGFAGVGDYARSNGNTWDVIETAHAMRDGRWDKAPANVVDTGETHDLVVVGGGFAGLGAAHYFRRKGGDARTVLVLDNHAMFGGEAKRNEFIVRGQRLIGPQGSNDFGVPGANRAWLNELWTELGLPREFRYQSLSAERKALQFTPDNYYFQLWNDDFESHGFWFDGPKPHWVRNPWGHALENTPWPEDVRRDLIRWRTDTTRYHEATGEALARWLDTMTYEQYLVGVMKLSPAVARYADPILAAAVGLGADVLSAFAARQIGLPGFQGFAPAGTPPRSYKLSDLRGAHSFPGGNDGIARHFIKTLIPDAIAGGSSFDDVHNGRIDFAALDRRGAPARIRLGATVVRVEHESSPSTARHVVVTYVKDGRPYRLRARSVVMASGAWAAGRVVRDLPAEYQQATRGFPRAPMLVVNVALDNWRFLYDMGFTACSWRGGTFGFGCNMRPNMVAGRYAPPLDPDRPNLLTYYVPFVKNGLSLEAQGQAGRTELLSKSFMDYERTIREQMSAMFDHAGFDDRRDIAGIILNRWGHAYVAPGPGFYFGRDGKPAPRDILRKPFGRISFAHSELNGHQNWVSAVEEGRRAVEGQGPRATG